MDAKNLVDAGFDNLSNGDADAAILKFNQALAIRDVSDKIFSDAFLGIGQVCQLLKPNYDDSEGLVYLMASYLLDLTNIDSVFSIVFAISSSQREIDGADVIRRHLLSKIGDSKNLLSDEQLQMYRQYSQQLECGEG
jgi:hypothetical protein